MVYKTVLFDFDGTLFDTSPGILRCMRAALEKNGYDAHTREWLKRFIGPPVIPALKEFYGMDDAEAEKVKSDYRALYRAEGVFECAPMDGAKECLQRLRAAGIRLAVAPDSYCRQEDLLLPEEDYVTIVGNLLENAVEELSRGEHDLKEIRLALYCRPDCNVIVCEDTGGGVDPEIQPHIFEKGVSSKGEGRGLGLCLIHQLVEQHHGTIDVMTEAGAGTCFTLTFTDSVPEEA